MKIKHYNEMMAYLTRPGFNGGGAVSNRTVLPKRKPAAEVKKRKKINYEKIKQYLGKESQELIERELGFAVGGRVNPAQLKQRFMQLVSSIQDAEDAEIPGIIAQAKQIKDQIDEINLTLAPDRQIKITAQGLDFDNPLLDAAKIAQTVDTTQEVTGGLTKNIVKDIVPESLTTGNPIYRGQPTFPRGTKGTLADEEEKQDPKINRRVGVTPEGQFRQASMKGRQTEKNIMDYFRRVLSPKNVDLTATEGSFAEGGDVDTPKRGLVDGPGSYAGDDEYGKFLNPRKSRYTGKILAFEVRSRDPAYTKKPFYKKFLVSEYGSVDAALEAAKKTRAEAFPSYLSNEKFMELRKEKINLTNREFADYLNDETPYRPSVMASKQKGTGKWTKSNVKNKMNLQSKKLSEFADLKNPFKVEKKIVSTDVADKIYEEYLQAVKEGKREGSVIGLGRKYFPGETKGSQQKAIQRILRERGVDITPFKKTGPGTGNKKTKKERIKKLIEGKKFAGSEAGQLSDEILLDIKAMNDKVKNMSLEDIAANKKYIKSMRLNASMDNLSKGKFVFDKYKDLTDLEVAQKIKDRAAANKFFDVEHISGVKGEARNIYYPNNMQMATGNIGSFMDNFKRVPIEQPNNPTIGQIDNFLSEYNLTVRDAKNNIRLGNKAVIEVIDGVSNIVVDNFNAVNTPFEKQTVVKPSPSKGVTKQSIIKTSKPMVIGSNFANVSPELFDLRKLPDDVKDVGNVIRELIKTPGGKRIARNLLKAGKFTGYGLASELAFAAPFALDDYASGLEGDRILGNATLGIFGTTEDEEIRKATGELGYATQTIDELQKLIPELAIKYQTYNDQNDPRGEKREQFRNLIISTKNRYDKAYDLFVTDKGNFDTDLYNQGVNNYAAGLNQIEKFRAAKEKERGIKGQKTGFELNLDLGFAGGGIAKQAGVESGPPPESGPNSQGLAFLMKRGR
jgi:hypothetical protein